MLTRPCPVIEICSSTEAAHTAVSRMLSPSAATTGAPKPRVVLMGGGFTHEDFLSVHDAVEGAKSVPWVRPAMMKPGAEATAADAQGPPSAEVVAGRLRKTLEEHLGELREGKGQGKIWWM